MRAVERNVRHCCGAQPSRAARAVTPARRRERRGRARAAPAGARLRSTSEWPRESSPTAHAAAPLGRCGSLVAAAFTRGQCQQRGGRKDERARRRRSPHAASRARAVLANRTLRETRAASQCPAAARTRTYNEVRLAHTSALARAVRSRPAARCEMH